MSRGIHRNHARRDVGKERLNEFASAFEFGRDLFQIARHLVKRIHERPDFIIPSRFDLVVPVPMSHLMGSFRQLLNGHRNALGEIETEPGRGKDDNESDEQQGQDVTVFDRRLKKSQMLVLFVGARDFQRPFGNTLRHEVIDDDHADNPSIGAIEGHPASNDVTFAELLRSGHFQSPQRPIEKFRFSFDGDSGRHLVVEGHHDQAPVRRKQLHRSEIVLSLFTLDELFKLAESLRVKKSLLRNALAQLPRVKQRIVGRVLVVRLPDFQ